VFALRQKFKILKFVVQYEAFIQNKWMPIVRYDTSHRFAHKDIIHYNGREDKQPLYIHDFNMAFTPLESPAIYVGMIKINNIHLRKGGG